MSDTAPAAAGAAPPGVAPAQPPVQPPPQQPSKPAERPVQQPTEQVASLDQVYAISRPDGTEEYVKLGDMVNAYHNRSDLSAEEITDLRTLKDAIAGKPEALQKILTSAAGGAKPAAPAAGAPTPGDPVAMLQAKIDAMEAQLRQATDVTGRITGLQERNAIQATIAAYKEKVPHLAKIPEKASDMVRAEFYQQLQQAGTGQHPLLPGQRVNPQNMTEQQRQTLLGGAMVEVESRLKTLISDYGFTLQAPAPAAPPAGLVNDQVQTPDGLMRPAQLTYDPRTMRLVRTAGGTPVEQAGHGAFVPTDDVLPVARGGTPLPSGPAAPAGRQFVDLEGLQAKMERRMAEINKARQ